MNLLDLCAVAIPSGHYQNGLPFGITLVSEALSDLRLLGIAKRFQAPHQADTASSEFAPAIAPSLDTNRYRRIAVCGAHMQGLPLNHQLLELGARFYAKARTSAHYRLYALAIAPPERPGLIRDEANGQAIELELWELPKEHWHDFIRQIKSPLAIGSLELEDGRWEYGFVCEFYPIANSLEISQFGGWRHYLQAKSAGEMTG